jgi:hypothetical protein
MKRSEHKCQVPECENACPREYPFCASCWRQVPRELRAPVRKELAKRSTPDLDRSALYYAVSAAVASVRVGQVSEPNWERAWVAAGLPEL